AKMKRLTSGIAIAICTFFIGVAVAMIWLRHIEMTPITTPAKSNILAPQAVPDSMVYSVQLCDLVRDSTRYDQKIVRIQAIYQNDTDTSALVDPDCVGAWLRPTCDIKNSSCNEILDRKSTRLNSSHT